MQTYMLAERLRRVENAPLTQEMIKFPFKHLPTDFLEKPENQTCNVSCEACSTAVPIDGGKKYCARFQVTVYCSKACQKADWKRHKKACGKDTHNMQAYKAYLEMVFGYTNSEPGLNTFLRVMHCIHWNDSPVIVIKARAGTDGANPTVQVVPKRYWGPRLPEDDHVAKYYEDGPRKDGFKVTYDLQHLGPVLAQLSNTAKPEMTQCAPEEILEADDLTYDLAIVMAREVQQRGLVRYVQGRTTLPMSVREMDAIYNSDMEIQGRRGCA